MIEVVEIESAEIKADAWTNFLTSVDWESDEKNFKFEFSVMTKKFGQAFMVFCQAQWATNDGILSEDEFCKMNANMPKKFFDNRIRR